VRFKFSEWPASCKFTESHCFRVPGLSEANGRQNGANPKRTGAGKDLQFSPQKVPASRSTRALSDHAPASSLSIFDFEDRIKTELPRAAATMNGDNYSSRGARAAQLGARIDADRCDTESGRHGSSRDYPVSRPLSPLLPWPKLTQLSSSLPEGTATTGAIEAIPETAAADAEGPVLPTTAAADPVAKMATSTPTPPAEATAIASARTATQGVTVGVRGNGIVTGAAGVGETTTTGATAVGTGT
jgi:hypothetical protein